MTRAFRNWAEMPMKLHMLRAVHTAAKLQGCATANKGFKARPFEPAGLISREWRPWNPPEGGPRGHLSALDVPKRLGVRVRLAAAFGRCPVSKTIQPPWILNRKRLFFTYAAYIYDSRAWFPCQSGSKLPHSKTLRDFLRRWSVSGRVLIQNPLASHAVDQRAEGSPHAQLAATRRTSRSVLDCVRLAAALGSLPGVKMIQPP